MQLWWPPSHPALRARHHSLRSPGRQPTQRHCSCAVLCVRAPQLLLTAFFRMVITGCLCGASCRPMCCTAACKARAWRHEAGKSAGHPQCAMSPTSCARYKMHAACWPEWLRTVHNRHQASLCTPGGRAASRGAPAGGSACPCPSAQSAMGGSAQQAQGRGLGSKAWQAAGC